MIFEKELTNLGFTLDGNLLTYPYSDTEVIQARVEDYRLPGDKVCMCVNDLRISNPKEDGVCYMLIAFGLLFESIHEFLTLLRLLGHRVRTGKQVAVRT